MSHPRCVCGSEGLPLVAPDAWSPVSSANCTRAALSIFIVPVVLFHRLCPDLWPVLAPRGIWTKRSPLRAIQKAEPYVGQQMAYSVTRTARTVQLTNCGVDAHFMQCHCSGGKFHLLLLHAFLSNSWFLLFDIHYVIFMLIMMLDAPPVYFSRLLKTWKLSLSCFSVLWDKGCVDIFWPLGGRKNPN